MKRKIIILISLAAILSAGTLACQAPAVTTKKTIVVTYSVLGSVVKDLVDDRANVIVFVPNGLDPHEWEPSAKNIETINKADLIIENGLGLEGGMQKTLQAARNKGIRFFTASEYITVRHVGPGEGIPTSDPDQAIGAADPHFWTDPVMMKMVAGALVPILSRELNLNVSGQAADLINRLDKLNTDVVNLTAQLPPNSRKMVTGHESMGYFAQRYGFKLVGVLIPSLSSQAGVSASDLAFLKQSILDNHVKAIFTELGTSPAVAKVISSETGVKLVELSTHRLAADGSYFTFMTQLATVIVNALK
jgi:zinc/manganese transport system substrate-binding protein